MKTAFLFPGQGVQSPGMGSDLYQSYGRYRETFDRCAEGAGLDLQSACFAGEGMEDSGVIQSAIYAHSVALLRTLESEGVQADVYAGLSLGEYAALCAAGVLEDAQGTSLVYRRGTLMDDAVPPGTGGMLSVIGLAIDQLEAAIAHDPNIYVANHLSETQMVLGGLTEDLCALKPELEAAGAKMVTLLALKGPSHCPLLNDAALRFSAELKGETLGVPLKPVYSNALGAPYPKDADVRALLCTQLCRRVRWHDTVEHMLKKGVTRFVEIGPGSVLTKMLKRRVPRDVQLYSVKDAASLDAFLRACREEQS